MNREHCDPWRHSTGASGVASLSTDPRSRACSVALSRTVDQEFRDRLARVFTAGSRRKLEDFPCIERVGEPHGQRPGRGCGERGGRQRRRRERGRRFPLMHSFTHRDLGSPGGSRRFARRNSEDQYRECGDEGKRNCAMAPGAHACCSGRSRGSRFLPIRLAGSRRQQFLGAQLEFDGAEGAQFEFDDAQALFAIAFARWRIAGRVPRESFGSRDRGHIRSVPRLVTSRSR